MIRLIVGIANNPNIMLSNVARDNVGAWWVLALCRKYNMPIRRFDLIEHTAITDPFFLDKENQKFSCAVTSTHLNDAGNNVAKIVRHLNIDVPEILVVHDDLTVDVGDVRLKAGKSDTSHKGINSIAEALHSDDFHRLRVGIGRPEGDKPLTNYLRESPTLGEKLEIDKAIDDSLYFLPHILGGDWQSAMSYLNRPKTAARFRLR